MAVLQQQRAFLQELYSRGTLDEGGHEELLHHVDSRTRQLEIVGELGGAG